MTRRLALLTTILVLALPAAASAQSSAFGPLPQAPTPTPTVVQAPKVDDGTTGRTILFGIGGVLIVGFLVMGWFIMRDARAAIPEAELAGGLRDAGPHRHKMQAKAKARKKTHAQKAARKAHRKR
ncbi:MAG TPA: hypothetical protein VI300_20115 [Solirubrobacter sp.]